MASTAKLSEEIDSLLEHYLCLLDQYRSLQTHLKTLQSSVHQHIARANFTAERGLRYGADMYDARMRAARACRITVPAPPDPSTTSLDWAPRTSGAADMSTTVTTASPWPAGGLTSEKERPLTTSFTISAAAPVQFSGGAEASDAEEKTQPSPKDPIRMFGILTPPSLRIAQSDSIKVIEDIIPQLLSTDAEMKEVERQIRRARKQRLKVEAKEKASTAVGDQELGMKSLHVAA